MTSRLKTFVRTLPPTPAELIAVALALAVVTGLVLASSFDSGGARGSIALWLLTSGAKEWVRAVHFWTAPLLVCGVILQLAETRPAAATPRWKTQLSWATVLGLALYVAIAGVLLRGDAGTEPIRRSLVATFDRAPVPGGILGTVFWGQTGGANLMYFQHAAVATTIVLAVMAFRLRGAKVRIGRLVAIACTVATLAALASPGLREDVTADRGLSALLAEFRLGGPLRSRTPEGSQLPVGLREVRGRPEGCLVCHAAVSGLGAAHDPAAIGCAACHGGDTLALDGARAHRTMVRIPGNLADAPRTCGQVGCHESIVPRVERSIMATMAGVISVDRDVFGAAAAPGLPPHVRELGVGPADTHLRQLCASCHLGQTKAAWGPNTDSSRGGGCTACHLHYAPEAKAQLTAYETSTNKPDRTVPLLHPALSVNADTGNCFGCHSRSSRISTNYEGWIETEVKSAETVVNRTGRRVLADGRVLARVTADVHHERGLDCIDCHIAGEVMGKDLVVGRKHDQVKVRCEDCHTDRFATIDPTLADAETEKLLRLRGVSVAPGQRLATTRTGEPLVNVIVEADGRAQLRTKARGEMRPLRAAGPQCARDSAHGRLSCGSCHSAWAPRCISCHTRFDPRGQAFDHLAQTWVTGAWEESGEAAQAVPPTLGVRLRSDDPTHAGGVVETFIPGMILDLDRNRDPARPTDLVSVRLYARTAPHTTATKARSCASCHADPVALGVGEGVLRYVVTGTVGRWEFRAKHAVGTDGIPADAWTTFLQDRTGTFSTRSDVRPFDAAEQRRILRVGACLTCHEGESTVMQQSLVDFPAVLRNRSPRCVLPAEN